MKKKETLKYFVAFFRANAMLQKRPNLRLTSFFKDAKEKKTPSAILQKKMTRCKIIFL